MITFSLSSRALNLASRHEEGRKTVGEKEKPSAHRTLSAINKCRHECKVNATNDVSEIVNREERTESEREGRQLERRNENHSKSVFSLLVLVLAFIVYSNLVETKKK